MTSEVEQLQKLAQKLLIRRGSRVLVLGAPESYLGRLATFGATVSAASDPGPHDVVQLFVPNRAQLESELPKAIEAAGENAVLWLSYPKLSSSQAGDLSRDRIVDLVSTTGWTPVSAVAIDETWSALRLRPVSQVGVR